MNRRLVLATHNRHKAEELSVMLEGAGIEILTLDSFPAIGDIQEDEPTLEGNALTKARAIFQQTQLPSLADDTGLEVSALNGAPGVFSARYAGEEATYADNCRKLIAAMRDIPLSQRTARFRSVLAFVASTDVEKIVEGVCDGVIIENPRGTMGFGYDPLFMPEGHELTYAEMSLKLKNTLSHRAKALAHMRHVLLDYYHFPQSES